MKRVGRPSGRVRRAESRAMGIPGAFSTTDLLAEIGQHPHDPEARLIHSYGLYSSLTPGTWIHSPLSTLARRIRTTLISRSPPGSPELHHGRLRDKGHRLDHRSCRGTQDPAPSPRDWKSTARVRSRIVELNSTALLLPFLVGNPYAPRRSQPTITLPLPL